MSLDRPALPAEVRRRQIRALIDERGFARVAQLSDRFGVSEVTVRGDLDALAEAQAVERVHGGAVAAHGGHELPFETSQHEQGDAKRLIAKAAAALVKSDQAVILDVGTTTTAIAEAMLERDELENVIVITNALNIAVLLEQAIPRFTVIVTGGTVRPLQHSLVDPLAGVVLDRIRADVAFIGCSGVDAAAGVTNINLPEADVKRRMMAASARTVVVADASKLGVVQLSRVAPLDEVDTLITTGITTGITAGHDDAVQQLRAAGLSITVAG